MEENSLTPEPRLADDLIERLNLLLEHSQAARDLVEQMFTALFLVPPSLEDHPTLQTRFEHRDLPVTTSFLGLLNAICGVIEKPHPGEPEEVRQLGAGGHFDGPLLRSSSLYSYGFITAVWEHGSLVRFQRTDSK